MGSAGLVVWCLVALGCGRIGFDGDSRDGPPMVPCAGLAATCGPAGTSLCCTSQLVPGGTFYRSYDVGTDNMYTDMTSPATVSDFRLDTYEVTVGRFRQFVNAGFGTQANPPPAGAGARTLDGMASQGGWDPSWNASLDADTTTLAADVKCNDTHQSWTDAPGANEALPMNCITWFEAMAFCTWDGGFLPTEAEWNYAAAGGSEQRARPWSSPPSSLTIDCTYANYNNCVNALNGALNRVGSESPTGDGRWGQADLGGNVLEWMLDAYAGTYTNPCSDCADLTGASHREIRGGSFDVLASSVRGAVRYLGPTPDVHGEDLGMRCARTP